MAETITGSIEIIHDDGTNEGLAGRAFTAAVVPDLLATIWGMTAIAVVDPAPAGAVAAWTAQTPDSRAVTVLLHETTPFDATLIGKVLMQQREEG